MPTLLGGALCLDFVNTVDPRHAERRTEFLNDYVGLVAWSRHAGALAPDAAERLLADAERRPDDAAAAYRRAIELRESLYALFAAVSVGDTPPEGALEHLNEELGRSLAMARVVPDGAAFRWDWADGRGRLDAMLWPVVRSAAELLTSDRLRRVHECPGHDGCGWLFLDTSKNETRRWCDMKFCGNRAKARRHYARTRANRRGAKLQ